MRTVLFYRDYRGVAGGHLKVWHYYNHVLSSGNFAPQIYFSPETEWGGSNPWRNEKKRVVTVWEPEDSDVLFLAGMDWLMLPEKERINYKRPIINLIQSIRHCNPSNERYVFLNHRAIRISYNPEVFDAINRLKANGPSFYIPLGMEFLSTDENSDINSRENDILIAGLKSPPLAEKLESALRGKGWNVKSIINMLPREDFIDHIRHSKTAIFLPSPEEGFFFPPLEGMAAGTLVICPNMPGISTEYQDGYNCFRPENELNSIITAVEMAVCLDPIAREELLINAKTTVSRHGLQEERMRFLEILEEADRIW